MNERKCLNCGEWNNTSYKHCSKCGALLNPEVIAEKEKALHAEESLREKLENENRFERWIRKLEASNKPGHKIFLAVARVVFNIYMGFISFILWLIAWLAG